MRSKRTGLLLPLLAALLVLAACSNPDSSDSTGGAGTITFAYDGWSGTYLPTYVLKQVLEQDMDYSVEVVDASTVPGAFQYVADGRADVFTSGWFPSRDFTFARHPQLVKLGTVYGGKARDAYEGWMVPNHVAQQFNLRHVSDLRDDQVASAFDSDGDGMGNIIGCPADWACAHQNPEILSDYGLSSRYEVERQETEEGLLTAVRQHFEEGNPVVFYMIQPAAFSGDFSVMDRARWLEGTEAYLPLTFNRIIVRSDFVANHPEVTALLEEVKIPGPDIADAMSRIKDEGSSRSTLTEIARQWTANHRSEVDSWLQAARD